MICIALKNVTVEDCRQFEAVLSKTNLFKFCRVMYFVSDTDVLLKCYHTDLVITDKEGLHIVDSNLDKVFRQNIKEIVIDGVDIDTIKNSEVYHSILDIDFIKSTNCIDSLSALSKTEYLTIKEAATGYSADGYTILDCMFRITIDGTKVYRDGEYIGVLGSKSIFDALSKPVDIQMYDSFNNSQIDTFNTKVGTAYEAFKYSSTDFKNLISYKEKIFDFISNLTTDADIAEYMHIVNKPYIPINKVIEAI